jgi:hypothetical protein
MTGNYSVSLFMRLRPSAMMLFGLILLTGAIVQVLRHRWTAWSIPSLVAPVAMLVIILVIGVRLRMMAHRLIVRVDWNVDQVTLHAQSGAPFTVDWGDVRVVGLPTYHGKLAYGSDAILFLHGQAAGYALPLSRDPDCQELLDVLEQKTRVVRGGGETPGEGGSRLTDR